MNWQADFTSTVLVRINWHKIFPYTTYLFRWAGDILRHYYPIFHIFVVSVYISVFIHFVSLLCFYLSEN